MLERSSGVRALPGIGEARAKSLDRLGLSTVGDLLAYYPRDYEDRTKTSSIAAALPEEPVCISALVAEAPRTSYVRKGLELTKAKVVDGSAAMTVTFFNQSYVRDALVLGESYVFYGRVEVMGGKRQMTNPVFEREEKARFTGCIMPVYPLTAGVSNNLLAGLTRRCVDDCGGQVKERLPEKIRQEYALAQMEFSCRNIHFPESWESLALAKRRLIFEEFFYLTCGMALLKKRRERGAGRALPPQPMDEFLALLPYVPTGAQRRTMEELAADMATGRPMNRLVQGDVGSGKTLVAAYGAWLAVRSGNQAAMMVPTEILAEQHFRSLSALLGPAGLRVGLLTGSRKAAEKKKVRAALLAGEIDLIIGTHALLSEGVEFSRLALVITDEQHRFGVGQRALLSAKAGALAPHVLVMSATPIPRTLALIIYGDLDVSVIDELPPGRTPIETVLVGESKRARMYGFVRKLVGEGRQAYMVCPMVTEGEESTRDLKAVTEYAEMLETEVFPDLRVGLLHGKMKAKDKDGVMARFAAGEIDVLVATTVIEVGVDVPNAALMVIENAERFGLSQLHQLRGRVGRGQYASYCVLVSSNQNEETRARLKVMTQTGDGFKISEEDLKLRGPGDFFGARQHGLPQLRIADLAGDVRVLKQAQEAAEHLLAEDPSLSMPEHAQLLEQVKHLFAENGEIFN
ncbi:MAG: ATP-dependent DNA helicase RecG [Pseudoflavonifractor sp.]